MKKIFLIVFLSFFISTISYSQFLGKSIFKNEEELDLDKILKLDISKYKITDVKKLFGENYFSQNELKNIKGGWYVNKYANMFETHLQNFHKNLIELYKDEKKCETTSQYDTSQYDTSQYDTPQYDTPQCANISADMDTIRNAESKFVRDQRLGHPELIKKYYDKIEEEQRRKLNRTIGDLNKKNLVNTNIFLNHFLEIYIFNFRPSKPL